jgi:hypothetical protein
MLGVPEPKYEIGMLIVANYDISPDLYYGAYHCDHFFYYYVGVVITVDYENHLFNEYIYNVLCTDGKKRFFLENEMREM